MVEIDGTVVHAPSVLVNDGETAELQTAEEGREPIVVSIDGEQQITVAVPIYDQDGKLLVTPRLTVVAGDTATMALEEGGTTTDLVVRTAVQTV